MRRRKAKTVTTPRFRLLRLVARLSSLAFLLIVLLLPTFSSQQGLLAASKPKGKPYALIAGTVWGPDDRPVYGVTVMIRRAQAKKPKWQLISDHLGEVAKRVPA